MLGKDGQAEQENDMQRLNVEVRLTKQQLRPDRKREGDRFAKLRREFADKLEALERKRQREL